MKYDRQWNYPPWLNTCKTKLFQGMGAMGWIHEFQYLCIKVFSYLKPLLHFEVKKYTPSFPCISGRFPSDRCLLMDCEHCREHIERHCLIVNLNVLCEQFNLPWYFISSFFQNIAFSLPIKMFYNGNKVL